MRHLRLIFLLIWLGTPALAKDCAIYAMLKSAHQRTDALLFDPTTSPAEIRILQTEVTLLREASAAYALYDALNSTDLRPAIEALRLMTALAQSDPAQMAELRAAKNHNTVTGIITDSRPVFDRLLCDVPVTGSVSQVQASVHVETENTDMTGPQTAPKDTKPSIITIMTTLVLVAGVGGVGWALWRYIVRLKRRRFGRYRLNLRIAFATGVYNYEGKLCDIRRTGVAFLHAGQVPDNTGQHIKLFIAGEWFEGSISRVTKDFCAVELSEMLTQGQFEIIRDAASKTNRGNVPSLPIEGYT